MWRNPEFRTWSAERHRAGDILTHARILWLQRAADGTPLRWLMDVRFENHDDTKVSSEVVAFGDLSQAVTAAAARANTAQRPHFRDSGDDL